MGGIRIPAGRQWEREAPVRRVRWGAVPLAAAVCASVLAAGCGGPRRGPAESPGQIPPGLLQAIRQACQNGYFDPLEKTLRQQPALRRRLLEVLQGNCCRCSPNARRAILVSVQTGDWVPVITFAEARTCLAQLGSGESTTQAGNGNEITRE